MTQLNRADKASVRDSDTDVQSAGRRRNWPESTDPAPLPQHAAFDLCVSLYRAHKSLLNLRRLISDSLGGEYVKAISPLERYIVLSLLQKYPGHSQKSLSGRSGMSATELGKVMRHLEGAGFVQRMQQSDKRHKLSCLTHQGEKLLQAMNQQRLASIDTINLMPLLERLRHLVDRAAAHETEGNFQPPEDGKSVHTTRAA
jgi:DNA-binding MarR family transcriptional regulator